MAERDLAGRRNPFTAMVETSVDAIMRQMMFCLPGRVLQFDPETQLAQVECGIQRLVEGEGVTIPVIENVPVQFAGDGEWYFWHQITPGATEGLIHFSQRAVDTWIDQGGPVAPHERRMLSEKDAFFVPGVRSQPRKIPNFKNDGIGLGNYDQTNFFHLKSDGSAELEVGGDVTETVGGSVNATIGGTMDVTTGGGATINGAQITTGGDFITAAGVSLDNHTHAQGTDSGGDTEVDTDPPS